MTAPTDTSTPGSGRTGRPRDPGLDAAILAATRALLVEHGYQGITMQGVARIAGVHVPAIYRRWRTKFELVEAAVFPARLATAPGAPDASATISACTSARCFERSQNPRYAPPSPD